MSHLEPASGTATELAGRGAERSTSPRRRLLRRSLALLLGLAISEVGARVTLHFLVRAPRATPVDGRGVTLVDLLQPSDDPGVIYELRPGCDCRFEGVEVRTNSHGFRGPERERAKPENGLRVVALGDSVVFGWGVDEEDIGCLRLERALQDRFASREVQVINTGVPGYNTSMQAATLRAKGLAWEPDLVLVHFVGNDFELPNFLLAPVSVWRLDHCYLLDLALRLWRSSWRDPRSPFVWSHSEAQGRFESDPTRVPAEHRGIVGPGAFRSALAAIQRMGQERGFQVLLTCSITLRPEARAICDELGVPVAEGWERVERWMRANDVEHFRGPPLTVSASDPHPSALVHGLWSETVLARLEELGWLEQWKR